MAELTKEDIRSILKEIDKEAEGVRKDYRDKVNEMHLAIKGNEDMQITGMAENVKCLLSYKPELKLVRWVKKTSVYIFITGIITAITLLIKAAYK